MTRVIYVNGLYLPYSQAGVHAEDRGFQFGDAVYEVCEVKDGRLVDETRHGRPHVAAAEHPDTDRVLGHQGSRPSSVHADIKISSS